MKKTLTAITAAIFLLIPALCFSAYRIHLKDGREFTTDRYWEDGDQIKFKRFGGQVGIPKDLVREIEEVEVVPEEKAPEPKVSSPEVGASNDQKDEQKTDGDEVGGAGEGSDDEREKTGVKKDEGTREGVGKEESNESSHLASYRQRYLALKAQFDEALKRYWEARRSGKEFEKERAQLEVQGLKQRLQYLKIEVKEKSGGSLPAWWN